MITLGIETSCDETALALIETRGQGSDFEVRVIDSIIHSQADLHAPYGGVFPTLAKREHGKNLLPILEKITSKIEKTGGVNPIETLNQFPDLNKSNPDLFESISHAKFLEEIPRVDRIAITEGPGLEPALWVGINFAQFLAKLWKIPLIPINHMEGHIVGSLLKSDLTNGEWQKLHELKLPALALLVSGGHTELIKMNSPAAGGGTYEIIGETLDDAVGEAFDKTARLLGLPYPGGPQLAKLAEQGRSEGVKPSITLPRPMINSGDLKFSFSGLKTAVLYATRKNEITESFKKELAVEFENAIVETVESKVRSAIESTEAQTLIVGGGVSANKLLRERLTKLAGEYGIPIHLPTSHVSGDNALMIALVGAMHKEPPAPRVLKASGTKRVSDC